METFVAIASVVAVILFLIWLAGGSTTQSSPPSPFIEPSNTQIFILVNQNISIHGVRPKRLETFSDLPQFVRSDNWFRAVGMKSYFENFRILLLSYRLTSGNSYLAQVTLQIEPTNAYNSRAVMVHFDGLLLGYLGNEYCSSFYSVLAPVGGAAMCDAEIWFDGQYRRSGRRNSVKLFTSSIPQLEQG
jgi:hypothetical protein